jgi:hypothetical protein
MAGGSLGTDLQMSIGVVAGTMMNPHVEESTILIGLLRVSTLGRETLLSRRYSMVYSFGGFLA